jgi:hypothetical protein
MENNWIATQHYNKQAVRENSKLARGTNVLPLENGRVEFSFCYGKPNSIGIYNSESEEPSFVAWYSNDGRGTMNFSGNPEILEDLEDDLIQSDGLTGKVQGGLETFLRNVWIEVDSGTTSNVDDESEEYEVF